MDVRRFAPRQDAESQNPLEPLSGELLLPREKPLSLVTFFAAAKKVTRPRSGRKLQGAHESIAAYAAPTKWLAAEAAPTKSKASRLPSLPQRRKHATEAAPSCGIA
jgi:hypothetical protein